MKLLLSFLFIIGMWGCSTSPEKVMVEVEMDEAPQFLEKAEIIQGLSEFGPNDVMDEPLTDEEKLRLGNLIDAKTFFSDMPVVEEKLIEIKSNVKAPKEVDLRYRDTSVKRQDNGKCTAYGGVGAMENLLQKDGKKSGLDLSEWGAWSHYGRYSSRAFIAALTKNKIPDEEYFPQYGKKSKDFDEKSYIKIEDQEYIGNDLDKMQAALANGYPVYLAMTTPRDMLKCKTLISPYTDNTNGGHAILVSGYYKDPKIKGEVVGIIKNSWGSKCGDNGYQYLPMGHICQRNDFYCNMWVIKRVTGTVTPPTPTPPKPVPPKPEYKRVCKRVWWKLWLGKRCYWKKI